MHCSWRDPALHAFRPRDEDAKHLMGSFRYPFADIGTLPVSWGNLSSLEMLHLDDNQLEGIQPKKAPGSMRCFVTCMFVPGKIGVSTMQTLKLDCM